MICFFFICYFFILLLFGLCLCVCVLMRQFLMDLSVGEGEQAFNVKLEQDA